MSRIRNVLLFVCLGVAACSQGDRGATGAAGTQGERGPAGPAGITGATGTPGQNGTNGATGSPGQNGTNGATGSPGQNGTNGTPGDAGPAGPPGPVMHLSEKATQGLEISPVAPKIDGLTSDQVEQIGIGSYLANAVADCGGCHNSPTQKFLGGGTGFPLDTAGHVVYARNLTPDKSTGLQLTEDQFVAAIRTGQDLKVPSGAAPQQLIVMPWVYFRWMSTGDIKAMYAYFKAIPAVDNAVPADNKTAALAALAPTPFPSKYNDGDVDRPLPAEVDVQGTAAPDPDSVLQGLAIRPLADPPDMNTRSSSDVASIGRGSYLVNALAHCNECHTNPSRIMTVPPTDPTFMRINTAHYLTGGGVFQVPPPLAPIVHQTRSMAADLTGKTHGFLSEPDATFSLFLGLMSTGRHIDETPARPIAWPMPWDAFRNLTLSDSEAVWNYLKSLPLIASTSTDAADKQTQDTAVYCGKDSDCPTGQTCNTASNECVGASCTVDTDCAACQKCAASACAAPAADDSCLANGL